MKNKYSVLFLGSPQFAIPSLEALLSLNDIYLKAIITQPDRPAGRKMKLLPTSVKEYCLKNNLFYLDPPKINSSETYKLISKWECDSALIVAYGQILSTDFLELFPKSVVNLHASLLPRWRGASPIQQAIASGDKQTGVSLQIIERKVDAGKIIASKKIDIKQEDNYLTLSEKLSYLGAELIKENYIKYLQGKITPYSQDENQVTFASKIKKEEGIINWDQPAENIFNHIKAFFLNPGCWTFYQKRRIKIYQVQIKSQKQIFPDEKQRKFIPGEIIDIQKDSFLVATQDNFIEVLVLQIESKSKQKTKDFLVGNPLKKGEFFTNE